MMYTYKCPMCEFEVEVNSNPEHVVLTHKSKHTGETCENIDLKRVWKVPLDIQIKGAK